jgi:hypothetical protein
MLNFVRLVMYEFDNERLANLCFFILISSWRKAIFQLCNLLTQLIVNELIKRMNHRWMRKITMKFIAKNFHRLERCFLFY